MNETYEERREIPHGLFIMHQSILDPDIKFENIPALQNLNSQLLGRGNPNESEKNFFAKDILQYAQEALRIPELGGARFVLTSTVNIDVSIASIFLANLNQAEHYKYIPLPTENNRGAALDMSQIIDEANSKVKVDQSIPLDVKYMGENSVNHGSLLEMGINEMQEENEIGVLPNSPDAFFAIKEKIQRLVNTAFSENYGNNNNNNKFTPNEMLFDIVKLQLTNAILETVVSNNSKTYAFCKEKQVGFAVYFSATYDEPHEERATRSGSILTVKGFIPSLKNYFRESNIREEEERARRRRHFSQMHNFALGFNNEILNARRALENYEPYEGPGRRLNYNSITSFINPENLTTTSNKIFIKQFKPNEYFIDELIFQDHIEIIDVVWLIDRILSGDAAEKQESETYLNRVVKQLIKAVIEKAVNLALFGESGDNQADQKEFRLDTMQLMRLELTFTPRFLENGEEKVAKEVQEQNEASINFTDPEKVKEEVAKLVRKEKELDTEEIQKRINDIEEKNVERKIETKKLAELANQSVFPRNANIEENEDPFGIPNIMKKKISKKPSKKKKKKENKNVSVRNAQQEQQPIEEIVPEQEQEQFEEKETAEQRAERELNELIDRMTPEEQIEFILEREAEEDDRREEEMIRQSQRTQHEMMEVEDEPNIQEQQRPAVVVSRESKPRNEEEKQEEEAKDEDLLRKKNNRYGFLSITHRNSIQEIADSEYFVMLESNGVEALGCLFKLFFFIFSKNMQMAEFVFTDEFFSGITLSIEEQESGFPTSVIQLFSQYKNIMCFERIINFFDHYFQTQQDSEMYLPLCIFAYHITMGQLPESLQSLIEVLKISPRLVEERSNKLNTFLHLPRITVLDVTKPNSPCYAFHDNKAHMLSNWFSLQEAGYNISHSSVTAIRIGISYQHVFILSSAPKSSQLSIKAARDELTRLENRELQFRIDQARISFREVAREIAKSKVQTLINRRRKLEIEEEKNDQNFAIEADMMELDSQIMKIQELIESYNRLDNISDDKNAEEEIEQENADQMTLSADQILNGFQAEEFLNKVTRNGKIQQENFFPLVPGLFQLNRYLKPMKDENQTTEFLRTLPSNAHEADEFSEVPVWEKLEGIPGRHAPMTVPENLFHFEKTLRAINQVRRNNERSKKEQKKKNPPQLQVIEEEMEEEEEEEEKMDFLQEEQQPLQNDPIFNQENPIELEKEIQSRMDIREQFEAMYAKSCGVKFEDTKAFFEAASKSSAVLAFDLETTAETTFLGSENINIMQVYSAAIYGKVNIYGYFPDSQGTANKKENKSNQNAGKPEIIRVFPEEDDKELFNSNGLIDEVFHLDFEDKEHLSDPDGKKRFRERLIQRELLDFIVKLDRRIEDAITRAQKKHDLLENNIDILNGGLDYNYELDDENVALKRGGGTCRVSRPPFVELNKVNIIGFNNGKFDNLFFWREIMDLFKGEDINNRLKFVGDGTKDLKYIEFSGVKISDIRPLLIGGRLETWTNTMFPESPEYRKEANFEIKNYQTYTQVRSNWRNIVKYNRQDSKATFFLFHRFIQTVNIILDQLFISENVHLSNRRYFEPSNMPMTIAALAIRIMQLVFQEKAVETGCFAKGITEFDDVLCNGILDAISESFFGGYVNCFTLMEKIFKAADGEGGFNELGKVLRYLDFNSLYPSIMHDFSKMMPIEFIKENTEALFVNPETKIFIMESDADFQDKLEFFKTHEHWLFEISAYAFKPGKLVTFGKRLKDKSLIYLQKTNVDFTYRWGCEILSIIQQQSCERLEISRVFEFRCSDKFDYFYEFIKFIYSKRQVYKSAGNKAMAEVMKIIMNSSYGKLAEKLFDECRLADGDAVDAFFLGEANTLKNFIRLYEQGRRVPGEGNLNSEYESKQNEVENDNFEMELENRRVDLPRQMVNSITAVKLSEEFFDNVNSNNETLTDQYVLHIQKRDTFNRIGNHTAIASFITAQARCRLFNAIFIGLGTDCELGRDLFYCDTDSIICNDKVYQNLLKAGLIHPTELGKMKDELIDGIPEQVIDAGFSFESFTGLGEKIYELKYNFKAEKADKIREKSAFKGVFREGRKPVFEELARSGITIPKIDGPNSRAIKWERLPGDGVARVEEKLKEMTLKAKMVYKQDGDFERFFLDDEEYIKEWADKIIQFDMSHNLFYASKRDAIF